jgi:hypothetical protein
MVLFRIFFSSHSRFGDLIKQELEMMRRVFSDAAGRVRYDVDIAGATAVGRATAGCEQ